MTELDTRAMALIDVGIAAADPGACVARHLPDVLEDIKPARWRIIALGKAARSMAYAALQALPGAPTLVVTNAGNDVPLEGARIMVAGHPVPDAEGEAAAREVEKILADTTPGDRVLALISGGGSAMLPAPVAGLTLHDKQAVNRLLLASGADITTTNLIRQALSRLKGGGWLRLSAAPIISLILSDVPGDDLRVIASGGTVAPVGTIAEALQAAHALGIWDALPASAREALSRPEDRAPFPPTRTLMVGSNAQSVAAMLAAGATNAPIGLEGDVADCAASMLAAIASLPPGGAMAFGGETTVRLTGTGMGGRNQELALRFALLAEGRIDGDWRLACVGSDGRDGPGEAAGGLVGPETPARIRAAGIDPAEALQGNNSTPTLDAAGALVTIGATGTNVADLAIFVRADAAC